MKGLYAIVDTVLLASNATDPLQYARALLAARPGALQLRAKGVPAREVLGLLRALGSLCRQARVPLVANDRADLAALAGCEVVHIGQDDLPYALVHRIAPQLAIGISTHDLAQLERALTCRPAYVAYGPVFETPKKGLHPAVGLAGLQAAAALARAQGTPIVAVGGITLEHAAELAPWADACVTSDLCPAGATLAEVTQRALAFRAAFSGEAVPPSAVHVPVSARGAA